MSSVKAKFQDIIAHIDRRTCGYKRRLDALETAPNQVVKMLDRALRMGISAPYVLMDSWFTHLALLQEIVQRGLDVIGMVKATKQGYIVGDRTVCLKELYFFSCTCFRSTWNLTLHSHKTSWQFIGQSGVCSASFEFPGMAGDFKHRLYVNRERNHPDLRYALGY